MFSASDPEEPRKRIAVVGARVNHDRERTLRALESAFPVCFELTAPAELRRADGVLILDPRCAEALPADLPGLVVALRGRRVDASRSSTRKEITRVELAYESSLARPLRGRVITEADAAGELPLSPAGATALARVGGKPVWWEIRDREAAVGITAYTLAELRDGESLREHLRAGRFMRLLPLVHFIGQVLGQDGWRLPPLRASFVVDDPNLHWRSYGFLNYDELAAHAGQHGYHMGLATVPLDNWLINRRVTSLFSRNTSTLSLLMHGNDHVAHELGRLGTEPDAVGAIAQALRRIAALERRANLSVERIMAPPHAACSEAALAAMFRLGIEAACIGRPYPWRDGLPASTPLAGWHPAELVAGGLPVLPRYPITHSREDLALRATLGQPLILYGHHGDFADGLEILAQAARDIDRLGDVLWGPLSWVARGNYSTRHLGDTLLVRMHARRIVVEVPAEARKLRVLAQEPLGGAAGHRLVHARGSVSIDFAGGLGASQPLSVDAPTRLELTLAADAPLRAEEIAAPAVTPWPLIRRALVEGRDRIQALR